jgi:nucleoside phosphorylase
VVVQTDLPLAYMRSNSLEITDNVMAVAYQTEEVGLKPAGFELFDISMPESAEVDSVLRLLGTAFARRASAVVLRLVSSQNSSPVAKTQQSRKDSAWHHEKNRHS